MTDMLTILILVLPLASFLLCGLFGNVLKDKAGYVAAAAMLGTLVCTALLFFGSLYIPHEANEVAKLVAAEGGSTDGTPSPGGVSIHLFEWFSVGSLTIEAELWLDQLTMVMLWVVSFVGSMVFIFANGYMHGDKCVPRFFAYLSLFAFAMYLLILGSNFLMMFIGWEGVGLCSYLLIGYYYDKPFDDKISCADAGKKAFIVNRIGDFGFLLGVFFVFAYFGSLDFHELFKDGGIVASTVAAQGKQIMWVFPIIALLLFVGATGKSAQIPLYIWLPDAMAGPTPVSALIHAATMVTAGVYMLTRCNVFYFLAPEAMTIVAIVGAATAVVAASIGITQTDIKKVLAYSTVSQLGYMFLACGVGAFSVAIFHVFTHAFFKACLFLCSGSVIHAMHHEQDMTKMGGLKAKMPKTYWTYLISTIAIAGLPPLAGFWSKDEILYNAFISENGIGIYLWIAGIAAALMTSFYMFRSVFLTFHGTPRMTEEKYDHVHESPSVMTLPLVILAIGAACVGIFNLPGWVPLLPHHIFSDFLKPVIAFGQDLGIGRGTFKEVHHLSHSKELLLAAVSIIIAGLGFWYAKACYIDKYPELPEKNATAFRPFYTLSYNLWFYNMFCMKIVVGIFRIFCGIALRLDINLVDNFVNSMAGFAHGIGDHFRQMQNSQIQSYALWIMFGLNLVVLIFLYFYQV